MVFKSEIVWLEFGSQPLFLDASRLSDLEVRVKFLLENPQCKEGRPPDILLKSALRAEKRPKIRV